MVRACFSVITVQDMELARISQFMKLRSDYRAHLSLTSVGLSQLE